MGGGTSKEVSFMTAYEHYSQEGGKLDPDSFEKLNTFQGLSESKIPRGSLEASRSQANSEAANARLRLTDQERDMYVLLRTLKEDEGPVTMGRRPQGLGDKELLAEVLRVTNRDKHKKFIKKYPNIFPRKK